ncbi:MAG: hypothetical protein WDA68_00820 [Phycisphaerae bacterium]
MSLIAWEKEYTHPSISEAAANTSHIDSYLQNQLGYTTGLSTQLQIINTTTPFIQDLINRGMKLNINTRNILEWTREGSKLEDAKTWQARSQHHFYDPFRNTGLDNRTDHPDWDGFPTLSPYFNLRGEPSLFWIITGESSTGYPKSNQQTWSATRNKFYSALTSPVSSNREQDMTETFIAIGHILHMLEDMGVPAHTRNDFLFAHYRSVFDKVWGNPLETWVENQVHTTANNNIPPNWLTGWTPQPKIYDKVSKYWDTGLYTGQYVGATPSSSWGLAEQTNYQFLSMSTVFGCTGTLYQFPNPAESHTTPNPELHGEPAKYHLYYQGYGLQRLARQTYTHYQAKKYGGASEILTKKTITTDYDINIYNDYVRVTIPRTIDFASGLINYFFRGRLEIEPNCLDCNTVTFVIRNTSINTDIPQILKGGTFELFYDDSQGTRTKVNNFTIPGWTENSELDYDQQVTGIFAKPDCNNIERYTVVYKGAISENPDEPDEDDPDAIAVATLKFGYPIIAWGRDNDGIVSNIPDGNDFVDVAAGKYHGIAIRSNGSLAAWGWNDDYQCDVPEGNDFVAIAGGVRHSIALKSNGSIVGWGDNSFYQIDVPDGNDYIAIASGDYHSLAITKDGLIIGWGRDYFGETAAPAPDTGTIYIAISAGKYHSLALQSDGRIKAWGSNNNGQTRIYAGAGNNHQAIAAAEDYNFLLRTDGMLVSWGGGDWLEPGIPNYYYRQPDGHNFIVIAVGGAHILALTDNGEILSWGYNNFNPPQYPVPSAITFTKDIAAGWRFSVSLKER